MSKFNNSKKVLILEGDMFVSNLLCDYLLGEGYTVEHSGSGKQAKFLLAFNDYDLVVSDINLNDGPGGIELINYCRNEIKKETPFILTTSFSKQSYLPEISNLGIKYFLSKPFKKLDFLAAITDIAPFDKVDPFVPKEEFCKINIAEFLTGSQAKYDLFVKLSENKFIKVVNTGEQFDKSRFRQYEEKGEKYLYLKKQDFKKYIGLSSSLTKLIKNKNLSPEKKANLLRHASEVILEYLYCKEIESSVLQETKVVIESTLDVLMDENEGADLISVISASGDKKYAHQIGVGFYSIMIAKALGWRSPSNLYKIAVAGLFHDIGEKEIDKEILDKNRVDLTSEERRQFESHPFKSAEILSKIRLVPTDVIQIVYQHHETCSGSGFPNKLRKSQINPLARLLAVADIFCELVFDYKLPPKEALYRIKAFSKESIDIEYFRALCKVFNCVSDIFPEKQKK